MLFVWFCRNFYTCAAKKSLNISFFMEEGMVCEKQKLAGIAAACRGSVANHLIAIFNGLHGVERAL